MPKKIITIAGSDSLSGGGLQADLATFTEYGLFGFSAITSIVTVANDNFVIHDMPLSVLREQLDTIFAIPDIAGIKLGLLPSKEMIHLVGEYLEKHQDIPVVVDPVMAFKETDDVMMEQISAKMKKYLLPYADVTTPNLVEAETLAEMKIHTVDDMKVAAKKIASYGAKNVVIKGGTRIDGDEAVDVLFNGTDYEVLTIEKLKVTTNNGAGCTFASAIASGLVNGLSVMESVTDAKEFVFEGIKRGISVLPDLGNVWQASRRLGE